MAYEGIFAIIINIAMVQEFLSLYQTYWDNGSPEKANMLFKIFKII